MEEITVRGTLVLELSSKQDWVNRVPRHLPRQTRAGEKLLWVDKNGDTLECGRDFIAAEEADTYPVKVYRLTCVDEVHKKHF